MGIKSPKNKGASGEREAARLLQGWAAEVGVELFLERNLEQVRAGGADINGVPGLEIEVKRQEQVSVNTWWKQVNRACDKSGKTPLLMWRQNRKQWNFKVRLWVAFYGPTGASGTMAADVVMDLEQAKAWFQEYLKYHPCN